MRQAFLNGEAEMKARSALIDGYANHDGARLTELLGDAYVPFTDTEKTALAKIPVVIIDDEWFQDYSYAMDASADTKMTTWYNRRKSQNESLVTYLESNI